MSTPELRSPALAALGSGKDRANIVRKQAVSNIASAEAEADFVAAFIARRHGLPLPMARIVAALAGLGERIG